MILVIRLEFLQRIGWNSKKFERFARRYNLELILEDLNEWISTLYGHSYTDIVDKLQNDFVRCQCLNDECDITDVNLGMNLFAH